MGLDGVSRFGSGGPWEERFGYSRVVRAGDRVLVAGTTSVDEDGVVAGPGDPYARTMYALDAIEEGLRAAGARLEQVVRTRMYVAQDALAAEVGRAHGERFGAIRPVASLVIVAGLLDPRMLVEIEAEAWLGA